MAIVIILIGTILLMGILCGGLALLLSFEEKPQTELKVKSPLYPELSNLVVPERSVVAESGMESELIAHPQPFVPQLAPMQAAESLKSV